LSKDAPAQEKAVICIVGGSDKVSYDRLRAVNAKCLSEICGVVRFHDRGAEAAIPVTGKSASHTGRIQIIASNIAALVDPERARGGSAARIIEGEKDADRSLREEARGEQGEKCGEEKSQEAVLVLHNLFDVGLRPFQNRWAKGKTITAARDAT